MLGNGFPRVNDSTGDYFCYFNIISKQMTTLTHTHSTVTTVTETCIQFKQDWTMPTAIIHLFCRDEHG